MASKNTDLVVAGSLSSALVVELFATGEINSAELSFDNAPVDPATAAKNISEQRHAAKSLEELLEGSKLTAGKDFTNRAFQIESVEWRASDIDGEGLPFYAVLGIVDANGEAKKIGVGARSVVEAIAIGDVQGFFGVGDDRPWVKFTPKPLEKDGKLTGRTALELHIADGPFAR